eukprot:4257617-Lingulodinium_polyedra.AAC.1
MRAQACGQVLGDQQPERVGEAAANIRDLLTEHRWEDAAGFIATRDKQIFGELEGAEGAAK